ncbi:MAG: hypothetical protein V1746_08705 [bacterium]
MRRFAAAFAAVLAASVFFSGCGGKRQEAPLGECAQAIWQTGRITKESPEWRDKKGPVYITPRAEGRALMEGMWVKGGRAPLEKAILKAYKKVGAKRDQVDWLEIDVAGESKPVSWKEIKKWDRGVLGLEIRYKGKTARYAPSYMIRSNRRFHRVRQLFRKERDINETDAAKAEQYALFPADQLLVNVKTGEVVPMERGNRTVRLEEVTRESVAKAKDLAVQWLVNNIHEDGGLTYKYWPSRGKKSKSNNALRQWMATGALCRAAKQANDPRLQELASQNIRYNLEHFYKEEGDYGLIERGGKVKLGALALAAMALMEHPQREQWKREEEKLLKLINAMWRPDGSFKTFYKPLGMGACQNFYPGEALLLWAKLYQEKKDARLKERFMKSFAFYQEWHRKQRNPAFVPWHTQAYYLMWKATKSPALKDFIFEMNDWLLAMQQWKKDVPYADMWGRFYAPERNYGPPHASSTGVYLEGLADAWKLAKETGDARRAEIYRTVIVRGLRSVLQFQFSDDTDMFYIRKAKRPHVLGGIRTTEYDNVIRCDNVQHNLVAMLKILDAFEEKDFQNTDETFEPSWNDEPSADVIKSYDAR